MRFFGPVLAPHPPCIYVAYVSIRLVSYLLRARGRLLLGLVSVGLFSQRRFSPHRFSQHRFSQRRFSQHRFSQRRFSQLRARALGVCVRAS
jgi:hypothetical protein